MELPLVSASLGAIGSLTGKLDALQDADLKVEIRKLRDGLVLLSEAPDPPETARIWMKDVREMSYDMENCVDAAEPDWIHRMSGFKARAKEANEQYNRYMLGSIPIRTPTTATEFQLPTVDGQRRPTVVGLDDGPFGALCQWLTHDAQQLKVASILGVGGIGKTTLAQQLWREHKPGGYFACRAFVRTAKKPDMRRILRSILAQVRPHQPPNTNEVHELIHHIRQHLQGKRYFLIIDDLWATSVWDIARRAFPDSTGSRIITTTEMKKVALACCSYQSKHIFEMEPLNVSHSKELFMSGVLGFGEEKFRQLDQVWEEIIRRCVGLPLAIICISSVVASQGDANTVQSWEQVQKQLPTNTTPVEVLKQVLILCYNCLPSCLQTCLMYLSIYPENYMILKEDVMKQWVAEGFIIAPTENDKMKVAGNYFDKLVGMGLIQHIDVDYGNDVYYYAVHPMVHDLITSKSREENFITVIDYSKRTVGFSNKVSRLSLQFGSATYATRPESFGLSQVRSLAFIGLKSCYTSIFEFKVLRFLILHMWADEPSNTGVDLEPTSKLVLLRSLQVTCNDTVHLPDLMQGPKHLETLEINARVAAIPANIVHLRSWLHLRLGVGAEVPDLTGTLKIVTTLNPPISLDDSSCSCKSGKTTELLSPICSCKSVKTVELLSLICRVPKWIGQLTNLCILKFVVRELQRDDISNLRDLSFLSVLSLHVQQPTTGLIGFARGAFSALEYFEFRCGVLRLMFQEGTMPNLQRLKLGFNAHQRESFLLVGVEDLLSVKEISGVIGLTAGAVESDFMAAESVFRKAMGRHLNLSVEREELYVDAEKQHEIHPSTSSEQNESPNQECQDVRGSAEKQHPIPGKHTLTSGEQQDYQTEIKQHSSSDSQIIERSGPAKLTIIGEDDMHRLDQVLVSNKETGLEKLTLKRKSNNMDNASVAPKLMPFHLLEHITNGFSEDRILGVGSYGNVYMGAHDDGERIAVKVLCYIPELDDEQFEEECLNLASLQHKNIVRLVGYSNETQRECVQYDGKFFLADKTKRALCFEYIPNGSLDKFLSDESSGLDWCTRYAIIKGICEGIQYLHEELDSPMYHLDLKPANVLLDENMVPKVADFGLSRLFGGEQTQMTKSNIGARGYVPPEYIDAAVISIKFDIFSLGVVIIKVMTGPAGYFRSAEMSPEQFIEIVHKNWKNRLQTTSLYEAYSEQAKQCIEIALLCVDADRHKRPGIGVIIDMLNETETVIKHLEVSRDGTGSYEV